MTTQTYVVPNISCSHCTHTIERELAFVDGVESVHAVFIIVVRVVTSFTSERSSSTARSRRFRSRVCT